MTKETIELLNDTRETLIAIGNRAGKPLPIQELDRVTESPAIALLSLTGGLAKALAAHEVLGAMPRPGNPTSLLDVTALVRRLVTHAETQLIQNYKAGGEA